MDDETYQITIRQLDRLSITIGGIVSHVERTLWPIEFLLNWDDSPMNDFTLQQIRQSVEGVKGQADSLMAKLTE